MASLQLAGLCRHAYIASKSIKNEYQTLYLQN